MTARDASLLYELNTPVWLHNLSAQYDRTMTLHDIPPEEIQALAGRGVELVWLMGVWRRSPAARDIGDGDETMHALFQEVLPDLQPDDDIGSAYAIRGYEVDETWGGAGGLAAFRAQLAEHGISLMLDFVPNHTAPDHAWTSEHPEYYIQGSERDIAADPDSFIRVGDAVFANGRDPQFPAWGDVVQVNAFAPGYRQAAIETLLRIAEQCDGVRCDMAMLMLNQIFGEVWGKRAGEAPAADFWQEVIAAVRRVRPDFIFLAEAYWGTEQRLIQQGFDYCYDKLLYDALLSADCEALQSHLHRSARYRSHLLRFIENHDEERAAEIYTPEKQRAAAAIMLTLPGLRLLHDGQLDGHRVRIPVHLRRGPDEPADTELRTYYDKLLGALKNWDMTHGTWLPIKASHDGVVTSMWTDEKASHVAIINYTPHETHAALPTEATYTDDLSGESLAPADAADLTLGPWQVRLLSAPQASAAVKS
ncbi:MAG: alpha-amylase family glycosyl hydrolase [Candidatus Saccharibacteria bacterium]